MAFNKHFAFEHCLIRTRIATTLLVAAASLGIAAAAHAEDPWSVSETHPVTHDPGNSRGAPSPDDASVGSEILGSWIRFYQRRMKAVTVSHCVMLPSCSQYSMEAIRRHGPVVGLIMTMDRLMHEWDEPEHAPLVRVDGKLRCLDPVEANIFWRGGR